MYLLTITKGVCKFEIKKYFYTRLWSINFNCLRCLSSLMLKCLKLCLPFNLFNGALRCTKIHNFCTSSLQEAKTSVHFGYTMYILKVLQLF